MKRPMLKKSEAPARIDYMRDYDSLRSRITIDRMQLDQVAADQAQTYLEVCERHVEVQSLRDRAKDDLARLDAQISRDARAYFDKQEIKATEKMVSDRVLLDSERIEAKREYDDLAEATDRWGRLVYAFEQRMRMVRECVALYTSNYFTNVTVKGDDRAIRTELAAVARDKLDKDRKERNAKRKVS